MARVFLRVAHVAGQFDAVEAKALGQEEVRPHGRAGRQQGLELLALRAEEVAGVAALERMADSERAERQTGASCR